MKIKKITNYIIGLICIILGIFLIISPSNMLSKIIYIIGYFITGFGLATLVLGIIGKPITNTNKILNPIFEIIFGLILVILKDKAIDIIPYFVGGYIIISGIYSIIINVFVNNGNYRFFLTDIFLIIIGLILVFTPIIKVSIAIILGIMFILLGTYIIFSNKENNKDNSIYKVRVK